MRRGLVLVLCSLFVFAGCPAFADEQSIKHSLQLGSEATGIGLYSGDDPPKVFKISRGLSYSITKSITNVKGLYLTGSVAAVYDLEISPIASSLQPVIGFTISKDFNKIGNNNYFFKNVGVTTEGVVGLLGVPTGLSINPYIKITPGILLDLRYNYFLHSGLFTGFDLSFDITNNLNANFGVSARRLGPTHLLAIGGFSLKYNF